MRVAGKAATGGACRAALGRGAAPRRSAGGAFAVAGQRYATPVRRPCHACDTQPRALGRVQCGGSGDWSGPVRSGPVVHVTSAAKMGNGSNFPCILAVFVMLSVNSKARGYWSFTKAIHACFP